MKSNMPMGQSLIQFSFQFTDEPSWFLEFNVYTEPVTQGGLHLIMKRTLLVMG